MARPTKQGIDYFPLDCQFDDKIEMYLIESGASGLGVLITIWQMIYSNDGYFIIDNDDLHLIIKRRIGVDANDVINNIDMCLRRGIFDLQMHKDHSILTSVAIQKRYFDAAKQKKIVRIINKYVINSINPYGNWVSSVDNATNVKVEVKEKVKGRNPPSVGRSEFPSAVNLNRGSANEKIS